MGIALFSVSFVANVVRLDRPFAGLFSLLMVVLLLLSRREFQAPPDPPTLFQFLRFVPLYLLAVVAFGLRVPVRAAPADHPRAELRPQPRRHLQRAHRPARQLPVPERLHRAGVPHLDVRPRGGRGRRRARVCCSGRSWPTPSRTRTRVGTTPPAWSAVYGSDTLAYFALRDDKSFFFSSDGEAMIAYTYIGRYALASGDPIGRPESLDRVVDEFLAMCRNERGAWRSSPRSSRTATVYVDRGLPHLLPG